MKRISTRTNGVIAIMLALGLGVAMSLIVLGGREEQDQPGNGADSSRSSPSGSERDSPEGTGSGSVGATGTIPISGNDAGSISKATGLAFPTEASDFLTALDEEKRQLFISFSIPVASISAFISQSGLPQPEEDKRVLTHSSPLWDLNPEEGTTLSGARDTYEGLGRSVEIVTPTPNPDGRVTVRITVANTG